MSSVAKGNPKDSMKSTWRRQDKATWTPFHWFYQLLYIHPTHLDVPVPVHKKTDKLAYNPEWNLHAWIIIHAVIPYILHQAYINYTGKNLNPVLAFVLYSFFFKFNTIHQIHSLRTAGHMVGFLDGDEHDRDGVPDVGVAKVFFSLVITSTVRPLFTVFLSYRTSMTPADINWYLLPVQVGLYGIILDFWFYWYHRLMHEVEALWKFHRTHHLTKHPNPLLTLYADEEQEIWDIAVIPLLTYFSMAAIGLPLDFYAWWMCHQYVVFAEVAGHSGLRVQTSPPNPFTFILKWFGAELVVEDHDLHHRKGWKASGNYGKQTRLWDLIFNTCKDRIEAVDDNVDWNNPVYMPLW
ncbi:hypothetical protein VHEMI07153 [[Torrubiella] hemipterigena]|uniref:Fatty acid hydroxylase domain-containing protein n=1 Tax=[Torrubiella] hemipterigena TaxID=1531966 RepID=A0A0A1TL42_9HYPO|nr:hypothetical protein VHEMI07153 [[Torrubiella] hemipterigena]